MHPSEHPLAVWIDKQIEESSEPVVLQIIAAGAMYMGPVEKDEIPGVYKIHTPVQLQQGSPPAVLPVTFTCDHVVAMMALPNPEEKRIVTQ